MAYIKTCGECPFFNGGRTLSHGQQAAICSTAPSSARPYRYFDQDICPAMKRSTLEVQYWFLVDRPDAGQQRCVVCGSTWHLNFHHPIRRSAGNLYGQDGIARRKPRLLLCGNGNAEGCHGLAHHEQLHFRWKGRWEYILLDQPTSRLEALEMDGWRPARWWED